MKLLSLERLLFSAGIAIIGQKILCCYFVVIQTEAKVQCTTSIIQNYSVAGPMYSIFNKHYRRSSLGVQ